MQGSWSAWPHILIWFLIKSLFESSPSLIAPQEVQPKVHSECTFEENILVQAQSSI